MPGILNWISSNIFFGTASQYISRAQHGTFLETDLPPLPPELTSESISKTLWTPHLNGPMPFVLGILGTEKRRFAIAILFMTITVTALLITPIMVFRLIQLLGNPETAPDTNHGALINNLLSAVFVAIASLVSQVALQHFFYKSINLTQIFTSRLNLKIYRHALGMRDCDRKEKQTGDMVNAMGSDSEIIAQVCGVFGSLFHSAGIILGGTLLLFRFVGISALAGVAVVSLLLPLTRLIAPPMARSQFRFMEAMDTRVTLITQILRGIRVVKYFCWETGMDAQVRHIRSREISSRKSYAVVENFANLSYTSLPVLLGVSVFLTHILRGQTLDAATLFACISTFAVMQDPIGNLAHNVSFLIQIKVSSQRLIDYFCIPSSEKKNSSSSTSYQPSGIKIHDLGIKYKGTNQFAIQNITTAIRPGESVAIIGPIGCGKSTLLRALLGEVETTTGSVNFVNAVDSVRQEARSPRIAWVPQEAFIQNTTLLNNIQITSPEMTSEDLDTILQQTALAPDIAQLPARLNTEIGDHGVNLSGGQKQRVALARAAAHQPEIVFLDDPLSAVDPITEKSLVQQLLFGRWKNITRVVATHRLSHLIFFDRIIFMNNGHIKCEGSFNELNAKSAEFRNFVAAHATTEKSNIQQNAATHTLPNNSKVQPESRITEDETHVQGKVRLNVYLNYIKSLGGETRKQKIKNLSLFIAGLLAVAILPLIQDAWLALWLNQQNMGNGIVKLLLAHIMKPQTQPLFGISVYGAIGFFVIVVFFLQGLFCSFRAVDAGRILHEKSWTAVLNAPIRFFDSTPVGRIVNRFSNDISTIENNLMESFLGFCFSIAKVVAVFLFSIALLPILVVAIFPVIYLYYRMQQKYRVAAREAKRLDSIARAPRYNFFKETLDGLTVVRAMDSQEIFFAAFQHRLNNWQKAFHAVIFFNRWFSARVPLLNAAIALTTAIGVTLFTHNGTMMAGTAGLVFSFALNSAGALNWAIRAFSALETQMTSVERVGHFMALRPEESVTIASELSLSDNETWPQNTDVEFRNVHVRYAPHLPLVLKDLSFHIPAGAKAALVGRTGSGKTTLFQALFRFVEVEKGAIFIGGKNIAGIPLNTLRSTIAVIPQDPVLFVGTLRSNLDFFQKHSDENVWQVLERVHMAAFVRQLPNGLNAAILESGSNLSQGQRQLVCLARALLEKSRIIIVDEATANVDVQTDALVQRTIRQETEGITVIIIAHRMGTIADCEPIITLNASADTAVT